MRGRMGARILLLFLALFIRQGADGYGTGAPNSPSLCEKMLPGHGAAAQTSASPYTIALSNDKPLGGDSIKITLTAPSDNFFKGFLAIVKKPGDPKSSVGKFKLTSDPKAQAITCFENTHSAATHNSGDEKKSITLEWIAPNEDISLLELTVTFVRESDEIWQAIVHPQKLSVKRNALAVTAAPLQNIGEDVRNKLKENYLGCTGSEATKGCVGLPAGCIQRFEETKENPVPQSCNILLTWSASGEKNLYTLSGTPQTREDVTGYLAMGFSDDNKMGTDSVAACVVNSAGTTPQINRFYNSGKSNSKAEDPSAGLPIGSQSSSFLEGYLFCNFEQLDHKVGDMDVKVRTKSYYILLARGNAGSSSLSQHSEKAVSGEALSITDTGDFEAKEDRILIQLHGAFMIVAWLLCASTGMFTARYYKLTHTDVMPLNKAFWFVLHLFCMFSTVFLTACGAVFILVKKGGYYPADGKYWHPILGTILFGLAILQVLIAFCRPHPNTKRRPLFNWIHWTIGNSAHIVGIACIFLANDLDSANLGKDEYMFIMLGAVLFHVVMHLIMSFHTLWADKQMEAKTKRGIAPGPMKPNGLSSEAPGTGFRTFMLSLYFLGLLGCAAALVYYVCRPLDTSTLDA